LNLPFYFILCIINIGVSEKLNCKIDKLSLFKEQSSESTLCFLPADKKGRIWMSVKIYQNLVNQIKDVIDSEFGIMDDTGLILACSDEKKVGQSSSLVSEIMRSKDQFVVIDGQTFQKVYIKNKLEFITFIDSDSENSQKFLALISINTINVKNYFDEKYDKIRVLWFLLYGR